ncbi:MAG: GrpB family protein [Actinobacteria bacterium]|nr:GrpB family protein [Actinomycetota bacterium]MBO0837069.1 GrpB family protein [Actinomycetota bacterium]
MITVVEYDPAWPERFEVLRREYAAAMAAAGVPVIAIEHVGSTSVPGLAAKPIIDCDIIVAQPQVTAASDVLISLGFTPQGELGIPQRWAFKAPERLAGTNTYVTVDGCLSLRNHLGVRDVLRANAELRAEYAAVKLHAGAHAVTIDEYLQAKSGVVQKILASAGLTDAERASIAGVQLPPDTAPRR